jgi:hypothetical protein
MRFQNWLQSLRAGMRTLLGKWIEDQLAIVTDVEGECEMLKRWKDRGGQK